MCWFQGCFVECQSDEEQQTNAKKNVLYLYKFGIYNIFVNLLNMEIEYDKYNILNNSLSLI